eukprot:TRINITY_DN3970_c0_g1_i2.p1 TRINITY_DN3970_c0_g1~~TRINITY_DN3970_c0_g1_i2.p1  ORF type:complete len:109 (-),score=15.14 TRINITY_DN3970_c0_g1_i2:174-500(-)
MFGGLLKNHCCYPTCPMYLKKLATPVDLIKGSRKGLFAHLKGEFVPKRHFVNSYHKKALTLCRQNVPLDFYMKKMEESILAKADPQFQKELVDLARDLYKLFMESKLV